MKSNVGGTERTIRLVLGLILGVIAVLAPAPWMMWTALVAAAILVGSAIAGYCLFNTVIGRDSSESRDVRTLV